MKQWFIDL